MKKIFIFTDAHGNAESLKAILPKIEELKPDYIFSAGDLIGIGPSHNEIMEIVTKLPNFYTVKGNHEAYYADGYKNPGAALEEKHHDWIRNTMNTKYHDYLKNLPFTLYFKIEDLKVALTHYGRKNERFITIETDRNYEKLSSIFKDIDADIIIFGHDHYGSIIYGPKNFINIGTLGCNNLNVGFAKCALLTIDNTNFNLEEYLIPYDITLEREKLDKYNVPDKEFIKKCFLKKKES